MLDNLDDPSPKSELTDSLIEHCGTRRGVVVFSFRCLLPVGHGGCGRVDGRREIHPRSYTDQERKGVFALCSRCARFLSPFEQGKKTPKPVSAPFVRLWADGRGGGRQRWQQVYLFPSSLLPFRSALGSGSLCVSLLEPHPYRQVRRKESWLLSFGSDDGGGFESSPIREMRSVAEISPSGSNVFYLRARRFA